MGGKGSIAKDLGKTLVTPESPSPGPSPPRDHRARAIDFVIRHYWRIVYGPLRRRGYDREQAQDLTQSFFLEIVLQRDIIEQVDPAKGRFRPFLFLALNRYLISARRRTLCRMHIPQDKLIPLETVELSRLPRSDAESIPRSISDNARLSELIEHVLEQVEAEYQKKGKPAHWYLFREHVLRPLVDQTDCPRLKEVAERCHIDEATASNMVVTVKRRLRRLILQRLQRPAVSSEQAGNEIEEIRRYAGATARKRGS